MSLYSCLSGRSIRRIALGYTAYRAWLGLGTTFCILIPSRIFVWDLVYGVSCGSIRRIGVNLQDTAYMMGSYAVLVFTCPDGSSRCLIRRILQGYTAYRSWQRPECCNFIDLSPLSSSIRTFKQVSIFYSCIAALSLNKPYYTILQQ